MKYRCLKCGTMIVATGGIIKCPKCGSNARRWRGRARLNFARA